MPSLNVNLDDVLERIDDAFFALDDQWRFTFLNGRAEEVLNVDREDVVGEVVWDEFEEAVDTKFERKYERAMSTQEPVSFEEYYPPLDAWFEVNAHPSETGLSVYFRDVTDRVRRERELERYETIVGVAQDGIYAVDDGTFTMVNDAYAEMVGYSREELLGADVSRVVDETTADAAATLERELREGSRSTASLEATLRRADGTTFEAEATFALLPSGERVGVVRDVSERKQRERKLELYERIAETVDDGVYAVDRDTKFVLVNEAFCEMTGYSREELLGSHATTVYDASVSPEAEHLADEVARGEREEATLEFDIQTKDGDRLPVESRFAPFPLGDGETGRCGVVRDVSEREAFERRLVALHGVTRDLIRAESDDDVADITTRALHDILDVPAAGYFRYDPDREMLVPTAVSDRDGVVGVEMPAVAPGNGSLTGTAFLTGETQLVEDVQQSPQFNDPGEGLDVRSGVFVPIGDHGVLVAASPEVGALDDETRQLVEIVATTAAVASDRVDHERTVRRQYERLSALNNINAIVRDLAESMFELTARHDIEQQVCDRLADSDSYEFAWVGTVNDGEVEVSTESGVEGYLDDLTLTVGDGADSRSPTVKAHRTGEIQVVQDVWEDPRYEPWREHARAHGYRASASVPIVIEGGVRGTLNVYADRADAFDAEERSALKRLGSIIAYAITSVERDRKLEHERNRLEFMNRLLRHNLLNSLNVVAARLDLVEGRVDYEVSEHLETAVDRTHEMVDFVETVRRVTRVIGHGEGTELRPVDLGDVLAARVERSRQDFPDAEYHLEMAPSVEVVADDLLGEVLDNVLANAVQHNPGDDPEVWVDATVGDDTVVVSVADDGPGVPDDRKSTVFDQSAADFEEPSSGFGLYLVAELLDAYGGDIEVADNDPEGAVFRLTLRRA